MKNYLSFTALLAVLIISISSPSRADQPRPRPSFMPSTPVATKAIAAYTAAELLGAVVTREFPANHPFDSVTDLAALKSVWPGAKDAAQIDVMLQIVLDAQADIDDTEILKAFENTRYVIQEVMDVTDKDKADAFVRVVASQSVPAKVKRAKLFSNMMFNELLDPRLLEYDIGSLADTAEYIDEFIVAEGVPKRKSSIQSEAKRSLLWTINHTLKMGIDETPFRTADEAANCMALKTWLTENWTQISNKCVILKSDPKRVKPTVNIQAWDARW